MRTRKKHTLLVLLLGSFSLINVPMTFLQPSAEDSNIFSLIGSMRARTQDSAYFKAVDLNKKHIQTEKQDRNKILSEPLALTTGQALKGINFDVPNPKSSKKKEIEAVRGPPMNEVI